MKRAQTIIDRLQLIVEGKRMELSDGFGFINPSKGQLDSLLKQGTPFTKGIWGDLKVAVDGQENVYIWTGIDTHEDVGDKYGFFLKSLMEGYVNYSPARTEAQINYWKRGHNHQRGIEAITSLLQPHFIQIRAEPVHG